MPGLPHAQGLPCVPSAMQEDASPFQHRASARQRHVRQEVGFPTWQHVRSSRAPKGPGNRPWNHFTLSRRVSCRSTGQQCRRLCEGPTQPQQLRAQPLSLTSPSNGGCGWPLTGSPPNWWELFGQTLPVPLTLTSLGPKRIVSHFLEVPEVTCELLTA